MTSCDSVVFGRRLRTDARYFAADAAQLISDLERHLPPSQLEADDKARAKKYVESGDGHFNKGEYDQAIANYDEAIRFDPKYALAYNNRGFACYSKGELDRAIVDYDKCIRLDPKHTRAYNNRGLAYDRKHEYDRAIVDYDQAIRLDAKLAITYNNRGLAYFSKGEYGRAIADFDQAVGRFRAFDIFERNAGQPQQAEIG